MHQGNCMLASMFKGSFKCATDEDGFAFIDRDGRCKAHSVRVVSRYGAQENIVHNKKDIRYTRE